MTIGNYVSIITLNINGLKAPNKRYGLSEWMKKQDSIYMLSIKKNASDLKTHLD